MASPLTLRGLFYAIRKTLASIFILLLGLRTAVFSGDIEAVPDIRVAIIDNTASFDLKIKGQYEVRQPDTQKALIRGQHLHTTVATDEDGIFIAGQYFHYYRLLVKNMSSEAIIINGRSYRGDIQLIKKENHLLLVVNNIRLEDYLKGILYHEVSHYWPKEALKAQVVVCRTYAVYQKMQNVNMDYDVTADVYAQVYGGMTSERYRTSIAVEETEGEVLTFKEAVFPAYYHATCAGHTEEAAVLWNINISPLKGVSCGFCKDSPHFRWHSVLKLDQISKRLVEAGRINSEEKIKDMQITGRDASGRITALKLYVGKKDIRLSAKNFREIIGPDIIRSTNFTVEVLDSEAVFTGYGWGHGVGLCQWGAYFMARQGHSYREILKYYYPGVEITQSR